MPSLPRSTTYTDSTSRTGYVPPEPVPARDGGWHSATSQDSPPVPAAASPGQQLDPAGLQLRSIPPAASLTPPPATRTQASGMQIGATAVSAG